MLQETHNPIKLPAAGSYTHVGILLGCHLENGECCGVPYAWCCRDLSVLVVYESLSETASKCRAVEKALGYVVTESADE